jgi:hypothetical protein
MRAPEVASALATLAALSACCFGQATAPNPNSGLLGQGVFGVDRNVGSGYFQQ